MLKILEFRKINFEIFEIPNFPTSLIFSKFTKFPEKKYFEKVFSQFFLLFIKMMLIQSSILSSNPVTLPDTVVLLSETESEIRKIKNFSKSIKIVDFASKIPKCVQLLVQILLEILENLEKFPL